MGQTHLMHAYESLLRDHGLHVAQLLVTHEDFENADRAPRVKAVLDKLLDSLQSSALFTEESCSFSREDLLDSLQTWIDKARARLAAGGH